MYYSFGGKLFISTNVFVAELTRIVIWIHMNLMKIMVVVISIKLLTQCHKDNDPYAKCHV